MADLSPLFTWRSTIVDSDMPATHRHVALTLSLHMNERGSSCFPSQTTLSRETGLSERTVRRALNGLEAAGFLVVEKVPAKGGHQRNTYTAVDGRQLPDTVAGSVRPVTDTVAVNNRSQSPDRTSIESVNNLKTLEPLSSAPSPEDIVETWNTLVVPPLAHVRTITAGRRRKLEARTRDRTLEWWTDYFTQVAASPFLTGDNDRGWRATLDFVIRSEEIVVRIIEGAYGQSQAAGKLAPEAMTTAARLINELEDGDNDDGRRSVEGGRPARRLLSGDETA